ncbi:hypothetical protein F2Q70_00024876 [Brassica cretica]|uniref:Uncharacterized protein n=1 Tax=Brassica cretica TaxID=69181 RepID=A0A8S9LE52_BRACR|nr:hypothetical protein F2Q70_00024876 [Brassica cretica]
MTVGHGVATLQLLDLFNHDTSKTDPNLEKSKAAQVLPNLSGKIICEIIALLGEETFYYLGDFVRAGKRGYALVHEPSVLKVCDITLMVHYVTSQICKGGQFRAFFLKCINAGNPTAICYDGLHAATSIGLEESIKILIPNVPTHGLSTFAVPFSMCVLAETRKPAKCFTC